VAPQALNGQWAGRLSLKLGPWQDQSASGITLAFDLRSQPETGALDLSTALGTQLARLSWQQQGDMLQAELETSEGKRQFGSLEALSQSVLGEALPLQALPHWLSGLPAPWLPHTPGTSAGQFEQAGWQIDASELNRGRLNLDRPASSMQRSVTLRVRLDL
jgi:outer membrane lipoprotein LolB